VAFAVDLTALGAVPGMLHRLAADARACHDYAAAPYAAMNGPVPGLDADNGAGLINRLAGNHARIHREVLGFLAGIGDLADRQGRTVAEVVAGYAAVDRRNAQALDSLLAPTALDPGPGRVQSLQPQWEQVRAPEPLRPTVWLKPLADHRATVPYQPSWTDLLSPTSLARDAIWYLTGLAARAGLCERARDPMDDLVTPLVGDWAGMRACGQALGHLAEATRALASNAGWIGLRVEGAWLGNAADACWTRLRRLELALSRAPDALGRMSSAYLDVCDRIRDATELAKFAATELLDWTAAALLAPETLGISLLVKGVDRLSHVRALIRVYNKALAIIDTARTAVERGDSVLAGLGLLDVDGDLALPGVPA
jgi:hypothetical protein